MPGPRAASDRAGIDPPRTLGRPYPDRRRFSASLIGAMLYLRGYVSQVRSVHFIGIGGTAMASAAAAMQEERIHGHRFGPKCLSAHVHVSGRAKNRRDQRLCRAQPGAQAGPGGHRQRDFARQSRGGICAGPQTALLLAAGIVEGIFHSRQTLDRRHRHAWQDHHDLAAHVGVRAQRLEPELPHRRHPE